jgi:hypothetical protein
VPVSQTAIETVSDVRAVCECVVRCVLIADRALNALRIRHGSSLRSTALLGFNLQVQARARWSGTERFHGSK